MPNRGTMPNKGNIRLWVEALRSGKYKQGRQFLKKKTRGEVRHCCLGVGCEVAIEHGVKMVVETKKEGDKLIYSFNNDDGMPPDRLWGWLGVPPEAIYKLEDLASKNDRGVKFTTIADIIEKEFLNERSA